MNVYKGVEHKILCTMKVIAVVNHKGGCSKTTTAVNVSAGLARKGKKVLLIDLDPQANATQATGVDPYTTPETIYGALMGNYTLPMVPIKTPKGKLFITPSELDLVASETQLVNEYRREYILADLLEPIRAEFDFIIIDCPPSLGILTINALTASDCLLIPTQPHFFAVQGLQQLLNIISKVKRGLNKGLTIGGVFIADYDGRVKMHIEAFDAVAEAFPKEILKTRIRHNVALSEASQRGMNIFDYDEKSNGAKDYGELVSELLKRFK